MTLDDFKDFQYPQSDRRRCNLACSGVACSVYIILSVSSVGSEALQRGMRTRLVQSSTNFQYPQSDRRRCNESVVLQCSTAPDFQYPQSDRRRCNARPHSGHLPPDGLSVSSVGSEALQLALPVAAFAEALSFQYPQSDRRRCNLIGHCPSFPPDRLSVSSVGSEALQPSSASPRRFPRRSFSILSRIGGVATPVGPSRAAERVNFQYPQSDRRRCNPSLNC